MRTLLIFTSLLFHNFLILAQDPVLSADEVLSLIKQNHPDLKAANLKVKQQEQLFKGGPAIPKTDFSLTTGQYNSIERRDNNITITQSIPFPTAIHQQRNFARASVYESKMQEAARLNQRLLEARLLIIEILYLKARADVLLRQDSLLTHIAALTTYQYKAGETSELAKLTAESQQQQLSNILHMVEQDLQSAYYQLQLLCGTNYTFSLAGFIEQLPVSISDTITLEKSPERKLSAANVALTVQARKLEVAKSLPDLRFGYFNQTLIGTQTINGQEQYFDGSKRFQGIQLGLSLPIIYFNTRRQLQALKTQEEIARQQDASTSLTLSTGYEKLKRSIEKDKSTIDYYRQYALPTAKRLKDQSMKSFIAGDLDFLNLSLHRQQELNVQETFLLAMLHYHQNVIQLQHLTGNY